MYEFAVVALLALATLKLVDFVTDAVEPLRKFRSLLTFVIAVGATLLLDYSVFTGWGIDIRNADVGVWVTGFVVAGLTVPWRALFGYLTHDRARATNARRAHPHPRRRNATRCSRTRPVPETGTGLLCVRRLCRNLQAG